MDKKQWVVYVAFDDTGGIQIQGLSVLLSLQRQRHEETAPEVMEGHQACLVERRAWHRLHCRLRAPLRAMQRGIDRDRNVAQHECIMKTIEFETELRADRSLAIPDRIAASLPSSGKATVLVYVDLDPEDEAWREASYKQFLRDESDEDAVYDKYR